MQVVIFRKFIPIYHIWRMKFDCFIGCLIIITDNMIFIQEQDKWNQICFVL